MGAIMQNWLSQNKINWRETYKELEKVSELLADFARVST